MKKIICSLLLTSVLIVISYFYIDKQLVWFLKAHHSRDVFILKVFAEYIVWIMGAFVFIFYVYFTLLLIKKTVPVCSEKLFFTCNAVVMTVFIKDILKMIFGRYWSTTFICHNPSLISDGVYGFNWFKTGSAFSSFPSGHTALVFSFTASLWFFFPSLRKIWGILASLVVIGQIGMYYHFVSDVIVGAALGILIAFYNSRYWILLRKKGAQC